MRTLIWIPLALLAGIVLGGWGPRQEARRVRAEVERLRAAPRRADAGPVQAVTDLVRIPAARTEPRAQSRTEPETEGADEEGEESGARIRVSLPEPEDRADLRERIDTAMDFWRIRSEFAREAFLSRARFGPEESARFDVLIAAMNLRLRETVEQIAAGLLAGEAPTPETGIRAAHALTGAIAVTYEEMDRTLPASWRTAQEEGFDLLDFVDPSVAEPLIEVEWRVPEQRMPSRPRRRPPSR